MKTNFFKGLLLALALLVHLPGRTADIDLFVGAAPASTADVPNVLIILDNTANWNSAFTNEIAALVSVFNGLPLNKFKLGLMMFSETGSGNPTPGGAYVRAAVRLMDATNRPAYSNLVNSLDVSNDKGNGRSLGLSMAEAYRYFSGAAAYSGIKAKRDYAGNLITPSSSYSASNAVFGLPVNAFASSTSTTYVRPAGTCQKNYIIYIGNSTSGGNVTKDNTSDNDTATTLLGDVGGARSTTTIAISPAGMMDNIADEWARYMKISPEAITTYTVNVSQGTEDAANSALLKSMANVSSGKYFLVNSTTGAGSQISDALNNIFSEIQSVNSVFASVSLPVSVNTQGTYLNQVYVGMFRPDSDGYPRWAGNLKQYKIGNAVNLEDADSVSAINNRTGFITECARSYWTPSAVDTEWATKPEGDCLTIADSKASNYPDGNLVNKGAQAYKLRQSSTRTVKTCNSVMSLCTTLTTFDNINVTPILLGITPTDLALGSELVNWSIGKDVDDENSNGITTAERRLSAHGDVVHSRPVAINFGTDAAPNVVVFYGANDGSLRAINGNRTSPIVAGTLTVPAGGELWSFMPPEFYTKIKRLRDNTTRISFPNNNIGNPTPTPKDYGMDGAITAFRGSVGGTTKSFVYSTMRRGGRAIYAFDVTNSLTAPNSPALKWKIGCPNANDDIGCTTGLTGIGQTWSSLKSFTASGYGSGSSTMLITGGGYDVCDDYDALASGGANHNCTTASKGHYVYVLDADTGAVLKTFDTGGMRGVVADITLVRDDAGQAIYGYTADLGGNVYRINFGSSAPSSWTMTKIASLGCDTTTSCTANRKFVFAPSVVLDNGNYFIMLGSGDREKPLTYYMSSTAVTNYFFGFTDKPKVATSTYPGGTDCGTAIICKSSLLGVTAGTTPTSAALALKKGWYLGLTLTEQVVTSAVTIFGVVTFSTHAPAVPVTGSCASNLGTARVYNFAYNTLVSANGTDSPYGIVAGGGLPPSPVAGRVKLDNGQTVPFCIGCNKNSPLEASKPSGGTALQSKGRLYWYIQK